MATLKSFYKYLVWTKLSAAAILCLASCAAKSKIPKGYEEFHLKRHPKIYQSTIYWESPSDDRENYFSKNTGEINIYNYRIGLKVRDNAKRDSLADAFFKINANNKFFESSAAQFYRNQILVNQWSDRTAKELYLLEIYSELSYNIADLIARREHIRRTGIHVKPIKSSGQDYEKYISDNQGLAKSEPAANEIMILFESVLKDLKIDSLDFVIKGCNSLMNRRPSVIGKFSDLYKLKSAKDSAKVEKYKKTMMADPIFSEKLSPTFFGQKRLIFTYNICGKNICLLDRLSKLDLEKIDNMISDSLRINDGYRCMVQTFYNSPMQDISNLSKDDFKSRWPAATMVAKKRKQR